MFDWTTPLFEVVARVAIVYVALMAMLRLSGKREIGELTPLDLLGMLLLSETVSPAMTGGDESVSAGLVSAGTLLALAVLVSRLAFWSPRAARWLEGEPTQLVRDGRLLPDAVRRERISEEEITSALRRQGLGDLAQAREAWVETNGEITVVRR